ISLSAVCQSGWFRLRFLKGRNLCYNLSAISNRAAAPEKKDMLFLNRTQAGEKLAQELRGLDLAGPIVLAIPRGGAPVGSAAAKALGCPFDIIMNSGLESFRRIPAHPLDA